MAHRPNVLVMQGGGPTPVFNRSLYGLVDEAASAGAFGRVLGAVFGLDGLLDGRLIDLTGRSQRAWRMVARTPGAALGSSRRKLTHEDASTVLDVLDVRDIGYCFVIGGNDSADTGLGISREARRAGYDITVVCVPKTIDNDLVLTDHTPGYGSAARFVAMAAAGAGRDAEAMGKAAPVAVIEVMGRDAGWLAASAALAKVEERDAPHVICVPEVAVEEDAFTAAMESAYASYGFAVAVVAENARGPDGALGGSRGSRGTSTTSATSTSTAPARIWPVWSAAASESGPGMRSPGRSSARWLGWSPARMPTRPRRRAAQLCGPLSTGRAMSW